MDKKESVKTLLDIRDDEYDGIISIFIDIVTQKILNYCNIDMLPKELEYSVVEIVCDHMRSNVQEFAHADSTSFGDTKVSYNTSSIPEGVLSNAATQLNRFRVLKF